MPAPFVFDFFSLAGDLNRDRSVNGTDFAILAANFGKPGRTYPTGDLNGDGSANGSDFAILAGNFGKTVPAPAAVVRTGTLLAAARPAAGAAAPRGLETHSAAGHRTARARPAAKGAGRRVV